MSNEHTVLEVGVFHRSEGASGRLEAVLTKKTINKDSSWGEDEILCVVADEGLKGLRKFVAKVEEIVKKYRPIEEADFIKILEASQKKNNIKELRQKLKTLEQET